MTARMVLHGRTVPAVHLMLEQIDTLDHLIQAMPKGHPDRVDREREYAKLTGDLLVHRRGTWLSA
jgi:hypothetical protein